MKQQLTFTELKSKILALLDDYESIPDPDSFCSICGHRRVRHNLTIGDVTGAAQSAYIHCDIQGCSCIGFSIGY